MMPMWTTTNNLHWNLHVIFVCMLNAALLSLATIENDQEQTVNIGVIIDNADARMKPIRHSIEIAMQASNKSRSAKMNPLIETSDFSDSFKLAQTLCTLVAKQPIALFGISRGEAFNIFESYSRALNIPMFLPTQTRGTTEKDSFLINMCPSVIDALIDVIKYFRWERIVYLFDSNDAIWRLQKLYQAFSMNKYYGRTKTVIDTVRIPDLANIRDLLQKVDKQFKCKLDAKIFVIDLSSLQNYNIFMKQVVEVGMNKDGYHYILGTLDINGMNKTLWKSFTFGGVNVTGFQLVKANHRHGILAGLLEDNQQPSVEVALNVDAVAVLTTAVMDMMEMRNGDKKIINFRRGHLYMDMNCSSNPVRGMKKGHLVLQQILNVTLEGSNEGLSGKVAFDKYGNRKGYKLDMFHLSYNSEFREVGYWEQGAGLRDMSLKPYSDEDEEKPANATMIVTTIISEPFIQLKADDNGEPHVGNDRFEGYCIDMMKLLAEKIGMNYTIKLVDDEEFGSQVNNSWNGLIGELLRKEADIALASLTITRKREEAVYFTKPFMSTGISIMIKKPEKEKPWVFSFMQPLSFEVWGCILCGFFAVSFILYMVGRFSPFEWRNEGNGEKAPSDTFSFGNNIWYSLGALLQQGPDEFPRSLSGRILASAWWFFTLITISSYTANLAACLTFERLITPINSVDDLVKQSKIKYGTQEAGSTYDFFKDSSVMVYKQMHEVMQETSPSVYVENTKAGWKRVISGRGKYAFLLESSSNNYYSQRKPCKTMKIGRNLDEKGYGIATRKFSPLSTKLNIALLEIRERGDLLKLEQKWWYQKGQCGGTAGGGKGKKGLNLSNVSGVFHILIGGLVLAVFISISQLVFYSCIKSRSKKSTYKVNNDIKVLEEEPLSGSRYKATTEQRYNTF